MPAPIFGLKAAYRQYQCTVCSERKMIETNHTDTCIDYCKECSWKPSAGPAYINPTGAGPYRLMRYIGPAPTASEYVTASAVAQ